MVVLTLCHHLGAIIGVFLVIELARVLSWLIPVLYRSDNFDKAVLVQIYTCTSEDINKVLQVAGVETVLQPGDCNYNIEIELQLIDSLDEFDEYVRVLRFLQCFRLVSWLIKDLRQDNLEFIILREEKIIS